MRCMKTLILLSLFALVSIARAGTYEEAWQLSKEMRGKVRNKTLEPVWSSDSSSLFYEWLQPDGSSKIYQVDTDTGERKVSIDQHQLLRFFDGKKVKIEYFSDDGAGQFLCIVSSGNKVKALGISGSDIKEIALEDMPCLLTPRQVTAETRSGRGRGRTRLLFVNHTDKPVEIFWANDGNRDSFGMLDPGETKIIPTYAGHTWVVGNLAFTAENKLGIAILNGSTDPKEKKAKEEKNKDQQQEWRVIFSNHNVQLKNSKTGKEMSLTEDGTADWEYKRPAIWSPNNRYLVVMRKKAGDDRTVDLIEAAPKDQLQPKRKTIHYLKPGDQIAQEKPCLFDVETGKQIPLDDTLFDNPWYIYDLHWAPDSQRFFFIYNQRGHQVVRVLAVKASTGDVRTLIEEKSPTFIDYRNKIFLHHLDQTDECIWMSERNGWNHLYLYDRKTGHLKNQITTGEWVVRKVDQVDEEKREIWIRLAGIYPKQDPYYIHYARISFDGKNRTMLTENNGTHQLAFSPDKTYFVDTWSRANFPPVHQLRRSSNGHLIAELGQADASDLLKIHPHLPEPFVAKGRDGKTDIYGVIYRPTDLDPKKKYPIIESIYAGPHDHFVQKEFNSFNSMQRVAERGFIVVRIDGMGTNWRSKKFHDVCWKNLKDAGFPDRILWIKAAAKKYPYMDISRVGIYGGSAGGQNALRGLLDYPEFYKAGAADCGCHDNRMDKIWWNEQWMGWPVDESYTKSSNTVDAHKLQGHLLLSVGALDDNVDPSSTMQVVDELIKADKDFELLVFPSRGHGAMSSAYGEKRMQTFFIRHLIDEADE